MNGKYTYFNQFKFMFHLQIHKPIYIGFSEREAVDNAVVFIIQGK